MVLLYAFALSQYGEEHLWLVTACFGLPFWYLAIQHIYVDHDVMHGVTFPPYWWMKYLTHPFSDFISIPWEDFILEHMKPILQLLTYCNKGSLAGILRSLCIG